MATPTLSHGVALPYIADNDSPGDPNVFTLGEIASVLADSAAVSSITSQVTSTAASGALDSVPVSTADSKGVSAATRASVADSKALSVSANASIADSKALSVSVNTSVADSKGVSNASAIDARMEHRYFEIVSGETGVVDTSYEWGDVRRFGARGDGVTDDGPAIQLAIDAANAISTSPASGGEVRLGRGIYITNQQLTLYSKVRLWGVDRGATQLKMGGGFPTSTALIILGPADPDNLPFGVRVENMTLHCNDVAGSIAVWSEAAQEESGVFFCSITSYRDAGIRFTRNVGLGVTASIVTVEQCSIVGSESGSNYGIDFDTVAGNNTVTRVTVNANGVPASGVDGIRVTSSDVHVHSYHCERHTNGINWRTGATGTATGLFGQSTTTSVVKIDAANSGGISLFGIVLNGSTNAVEDAETSRTITANTAYYIIGFSGSGTDKVVLTETGTSTQRWRNAVTTSGLFTFRPDDGADAYYIEDASSTRRVFKKKVDGATTTDATPTVAFTYTMTDTLVETIRATVSARGTTATAYASYELIGVFTRDGGSATQRGSTTVLHSVESNAAMDCAFSVSGNDVRVEVTGLAGITIRWNVVTDITRASS